MWTAFVSPGQYFSLNFGDLSVQVFGNQGDGLCLKMRMSDKKLSSESEVKKISETPLSKKQTAVKIKEPAFSMKKFIAFEEQWFEDLEAESTEQFSTMGLTRIKDNCDAWGNELAEKAGPQFFEQKIRDLVFEEDWVEKLEAEIFAASTPADKRDFEDMIKLVVARCELWAEQAYANTVQLPRTLTSDAPEPLTAHQEEKDLRILGAMVLYSMKHPENVQELLNGSAAESQISTFKSYQVYQDKSTLLFHFKDLEALHSALLWIEHYSHFSFVEGMLSEVETWAKKTLEPKVEAPVHQAVVAPKQVEQPTQEVKRVASVQPANKIEAPKAEKTVIAVKPQSRQEKSIQHHLKLQPNAATKKEAGPSILKTTPVTNHASTAKKQVRVAVSEDPDPILKGNRQEESLKKYLQRQPNARNLSTQPNSGRASRMSNSASASRAVSPLEKKQDAFVFAGPRTSDKENDKQVPLRRYSDSIAPTTLQACASTRQRCAEIFGKLSTQTRATKPVFPQNLGVVAAQ
jgi:hypothetical protein